MKRFCILSLALAATCATSALSEDRPADARKANPQEIANFWVGKTNNWRDCKGGIYYGGGWEAVAWCEKEGKAVGIGRWQVDARGTVCHELTWYWKNDDGSVGSNLQEIGDRQCDEHVQNAKGEIFTRWRGQESKDRSKHWWRPETSDSVQPGFRTDIKRKINRMRRQLGV